MRTPWICFDCASGFNETDPVMHNGKEYCPSCAKKAGLVVEEEEAPQEKPLEELSHEEKAYRIRKAIMEVLEQHYDDFTMMQAKLYNSIYATQGKNKGFLRSKAPIGPAEGIWHAAILHANHYKYKVGSCIMMQEDARKEFERWEPRFSKLQKFMPFLDRDASILSSYGFRRDF